MVLKLSIVEDPNTSKFTSTIHNIPEGHEVGTADNTIWKMVFDTKEEAERKGTIELARMRARFLSQ